MGAEIQPDKVSSLKNKFYDSSDDGDRDSARQYLNELEELLGSEHPEYVKAKIAYDLEFDLGEYE